MKILEIVESVESGELEQRIHIMIRKLAFVAENFDHYTVTTSYASAVKRLTSVSYPLEPMLILLAQNNPATAKLAAQYDELRQEAVTKIRLGI